MKRTLIILAALISMPLSAAAATGTILSNLYAQAYCEAMDMGMTMDDAATYAIEESYISSGNPPYVTVNGRRVQSDVLKAVNTAKKECPRHF